MKRVLTAVVLIPLVLLLVFHAPLWLLTAITLLTAVLAAVEYLQIVERYRTLRAMWALSLSSVFILFFAYFVLREGWYGLVPMPEAISIPFLLTAILPLLFLISAMRDSDLHQALPSASASFVVVPYVAIPLLCLVDIRERRGGWFVLFLLLLVVWAGDIVAYIVGRSVGRKKLAQRISPNKTWEGAIASMATGMSIGGLLFHWAPQVSSFLEQLNLIDQDLVVTHSLSLTLGIAAGAVLNLAAQFGDLVESMMKRGANIKDSGHLLPGHGGMLDRIDAMLFAAPVAWYYASVFTPPLPLR